MKLSGIDETLRTADPLGDGEVLSSFLIETAELDLLEEIFLSAAVGPEPRGDASRREARPPSGSRSSRGSGGPAGAAVDGGCEGRSHVRHLKPQPPDDR